MTPPSVAVIPAPNVEAVQRALGYRFRDRRLCELALTHRSWTSQPSLGRDNERLEFLGDSILGAVTARWLYEQHADWSEGELTKARSELVSQTGLVRVGDALTLRQFIHVGRSQGLDPIPDSVLAGATEALLGAVFLDGQHPAAERVIRRLWAALMNAITQGRGSTDYKSQLQELCIQRWHVLPHYAVIAEHGPAHAREFEVAVKVKGRQYGRARGRNKKEAEQLAAHTAWRRLQDDQQREGGADGGRNRGARENRRRGRLFRSPVGGGHQSDEGQAQSRRADLHQRPHHRPAADRPVDASRPQRDR